MTDRIGQEQISKQDGEFGAADTQGCSVQAAPAGVPTLRRAESHDDNATAGDKPVIVPELDQLLQTARERWLAWRVDHMDCEDPRAPEDAIEQLEQDDWDETNRLSDELIKSRDRASLLMLAADDRLWKELPSQANELNYCTLEQIVVMALEEHMYAVFNEVNGPITSAA